MIGNETDRDFDIISNVLAEQADTLEQLNRKVGKIMGSHKEDTRDMLNLEIFDRDMQIQKIEARFFWCGMALTVSFVLNILLTVLHFHKS